MKAEDSLTKRGLQVKLERVQSRLAELEATTKAIRHGDVDAIVVDGPNGSQIFTLQSAEEPYRILTERMNEGAATLAPDGTILFCNRQLAEMAGLPSEQLLGSSIFSIVHEEQHQGFREQLQLSLQKNARIEGKLLRNGGVLLPVQFSLSLIPLSNAEAGICVVVTDLSCQNWAQRKLREQSKIFDLAHDAIMIRGMDGRIRFWNRGRIDLYGWSAGEVLDKVSFEVLRTVFPEPMEDIEALLAAKKTWDGELKQTRRNGTVIVVASRWSLLRDEKGEATGILEINRGLTLRKEAEEGLKDAALYTRSLIEASMDPLVTISRAGTITDVNKATEIITGEARGDLIGTDFSAYFTEPEKAREGYIKAFSEGCVRDYALAIRNKSGAVTDVLYNASVYHNKAGEIDGIFAAARDVTRSIRAEEKLKDAALYTRSLIEASMDPLVTISRAGTITDVNKATEIITGEARGDLIGTDFSAYFTEPEKAREGYIRAFSEGCVRDYALAIRNKSGAVTDVLYNASVYHNKAGEIDGIFAAARDVTRSLRAEEALRKLNLELEARVEARTEDLRKSEQQVRRKLESILSPDGALEHLELKDLLDVPAVQSLADDIYKLTEIPIFLVDREMNPLVGAGWQDICSKFHRVHPQACEVCRQSDRELSKGVAPGEFKTYKCKSNLWEIVTPIMLGDSHLGNLFSGQFFFDDDVIDQEVFEKQARRYGFDQTEYFAALNRVPRLSPERVRAGMKLHARLTDLLIQLGYSGVKLARAAAATTNTNAQLSASFKELEAFAYSVSHDLRAPLRHLDGFLTMLSKRSYSTLDETARHCVDRALEASRRMGRLIDDLLDFSRLGRSDIRLATVDVSRLVAEVQADLDGVTRDRDIGWRVNELPLVRADHGMLRQVFQNLLTNAIKFTRHCPKAEIEIGSQPLPDGNISIFVRDNGAGFDMQYYDKLFEVFQRLHSEHEFEGAGIGLALVRRIIERHGGRTWAEGAVGEGATFYFSLPSWSYEIGDANDRFQSHLVS